MTGDDSLAAFADDDELWQDYSDAVVDIALPTGAVRVVPTDGGACGIMPVAGPLHIIASCRPGEPPGTEREREDHVRLTEDLHGRGLETFEAIGGSRDGTYRELSVAVSGLADDEAREIGLEFEQVAIFAWTDAEWKLLACASDRSTVQGWVLEPSPIPPEC
ncbi:hypothetical protein BFN03_18965 [Rhodococcus sp. WMMA185]|uniref:DUF3293 domain-containing protein n=1 Tax=Rhodococcus sp. WMMA185 TaxID=679318 RepID=UPI0008782266|nr:DUF3293 domain-containing protein [Rhodococcus sp. WMMA185]AOW94045.1 hypothetical protein BFN03_18965 [Rhodococcus sp. WMMA185]